MKRLKEVSMPGASISWRLLANADSFILVARRASVKRVEVVKSESVKSRIGSFTFRNRRVESPVPAAELNHDLRESGFPKGIRS